MSTRWFITPRPNRSPLVRVVCVPPAAGTVHTYAGWAESLRSAEVNLVQLPGRGTRLREPPLTSVASAADGVADAVVREVTYPTVLFGHGLGALIAFETARRLRDRAWPLIALFASGCRAPSLPSRESPAAALPDDAFLREVRRRSDGIPEAILGDEELSQVVLPGLRAEFAMAEDYRYEPAAPLDCPIVVCAGSSDQTVTRADLDAWKSETRSRTTVRLFAGGPVYLMQERPAVTSFVGNQLTVLLGALARGTAAP